jgi:hypothetical protein
MDNDGICTQYVSSSEVLHMIFPPVLAKSKPQNHSQTKEPLAMGACEVKHSSMISVTYVQVQWLIGGERGGVDRVRDSYLY